MNVSFLMNENKAYIKKRFRPKKVGLVSVGTVLLKYLNSYYLEEKGWEITGREERV